MKAGTKLRIGMRRMLAWALCFCTVLAGFAGSGTVRAGAAPAGTNYISPEQSEGEISNHGKHLTNYEFTEDGRLLLTNRYHYVSGNLLTYSTVDYVWSTVNMDAPGRKPGYPVDAANGTQGKDWVRMGVGAQDDESDGDKGITTTEYVFTQEKIQTALTTLFGELKADTEYTIYMSEIFILRYRYEDKPDVYYRDKEYTDIDGIRGAAAEWFGARGESETWTKTTYDNFIAYYNIPMTFVLHSGTLEVVCIDERTGAVLKRTVEKKLSDGKTFSVYPEGRISVATGEGTASYAYSNHYNVSESYDPRLDRNGGAAEVTGGVPSGRTRYVFFGYVKEEEHAEVRVVCVDVADTSKVLKTGVVDAVLKEPCYIEVGGNILSDGKNYEYAEKYGVRRGFVAEPDLSRAGFPGYVFVEEEKMTVFLGYSYTPDPPTVGEPPTPPDVPEDEPVEDGTLRMNIRREESVVQIYADDYNPATGAHDDVQPFLVGDAVMGGTITAEGGIPSTERVALRSKAAAYIYNVHLKKKTGKVFTEVGVTVPYSFTIFDGEGGATTVSGSSTFNFSVERYYGYWVVEDVTVYMADKVEVGNAAFGSGKLTVPVDWSLPDAPPVPNPVISKTGSVQAAPDRNVTYPYTCEGTFASESEYAAASEEIGNALYNIAAGMLSEVESPKVRNDRLVIEGVVVLENTLTVKEGPEPDAGAEERIRNLIPDTDYAQAYLSGVVLKGDAANGVYASAARYTYREKGGTRTQVLDPSSTAVNGIKVHTPVVCDGIVSINGTETGRYADGDFQYGVAADFPIRGLYNPFTVRVSNYGLHKVMLGYGERDFLRAKSGGKNIVVNEVKFDFDVYYDRNGDSFLPDGSVDFTGDMLFPANTWIKVDGGEPRFYVLGSVTPGTYRAQFRSVAANCPKDAGGNYLYAGNDQKNANKNIGKYVATDSIVLNVHEDFMGFELNGTNDPQAKEAFDAGRRMLTLDRGYYFNFKTLTIGERFNTAGMKVEITPTYTFVSSDGKIRVDTDLYYSENIKGQSEYFVKVGNVKDLGNIHVYTNRDGLPGIPDALLKNTAKVTGDSSLAGRKADLFTFGGKIVSDRYFRMHPVITTKLPDRWCRDCYAVYSCLEARPCNHTSAPVTLLGADAQKRLVQEWYGGFYIPADTYAVPKDTKEGFCSACGKTRYVREGRTTCPEHGTALTGLKAFSFAGYAAQNTLTGLEEFFEHDGYIAISFEIKAVDGAYTRRFGQYDETEIAKQWKESNIPYRTGDVILYRLDKSIRDAYEIGGSE